MQTLPQIDNSVVKTAEGIRPFVGEDLPAVTDLYLKVFHQGRQYSRTKLQAHFRKVLLQNPWYDASIPSLVYEKAGKLIGFLGVVVRPMLMGQEIIRVAVSNHFMVDPDARLTKAGLALMSKRFAGPQDLTITEAGDASRKIWEVLGGRTSFDKSLFWTRVLCPARYCLYQLERRGAPAALDWIGGPLCKAVDALAVRIGKSPFSQKPEPPEEELPESDLLACLARLPASALRPHYDEVSLNWLLALLRAKQMLGTLRKVVVRGSQREIIGWYIYYLSPRAVSTVLQINAARGCFDRVFRHICYHAWRQDSIALTGRLMPRFMKAFCDNHCLLHWRSWMLFHSRNPKIVEALENEETFFTRLEGEFWISIEGEKTDHVPSSPANRL